MGFNRGNFLSALAGMIVGVMLISVLPAAAGNGDIMYVGEKNNAQRATKLVSRGGLHLNVGKPGNPALTVNVADDSTPPMLVNSPALVSNLNADLLDGMEAASFHGTTSPLIVSAAKFQIWATGYDDGFDPLGYRYAWESHPNFVAPIELPHGATITKVTVWFFDNTSEDVYPTRFWLYRHDIETLDAPEVIAEAQSTGSDSIEMQDLSDATMSPGTAVIDNSTYQYYIVVVIPGGVPWSQLYGAEIEFTQP